MIIGHFNIHFWLGCLFAVAFAGALYPRFEPETVLISTLVVSVLNFIALRMSWRNREKIEKLKSLSDYVAVFGMLVFIVMLFGSNLFNGLIWFVAFIQIALNLTFKEDRHYYLGLLVTFVLLSAGAGDSKTGFYLFYIIAYCVVASISLGYYFLDRRLQQNQGTHQHMIWPVGQRLKVISALIFLSFFIYLVIPRFEAVNFGSQYGSAEQYYSNSNWEKLADSGDGVGESNSSEFGDKGTGSGRSSRGGQEGEYEYRGFSESFDIRGEQQEGGIPPNVILAYMKAEHGAYLKVETFDQFDGIRWHKSLEADTKRRLEYGEITLQDGLTGNYSQSITIKEKMGAFIPAAAIPVQLHFPSTVVSIDEYQMIKIPSGLAPETHYTVNSSLQFIGNRLFSGDHYQPRAEDLELPPSFNKRIHELSLQVTQGAHSELEKATLLEKHLRDNYAYSFESIFESQNKTPIAKFLFEDKKGHCEYFASSMAIMLRSVGIPSRLVTGFSATVANPLSGYYEMRVLDGHAWVEAWVDDVGWAVFEPTPFYTPAMPSDETTTLEKIQKYVEQLDKIREESGVTDEFSLENIIVSIWQSLSLFFVVVFGAIKLFIIEAWKILLLLAIVAGIAVILWKRWKPAIMKRVSYIRVMSYKPKNPEEAIGFYMKQIQFVLSLGGLQRNAGMTIEQFLAGIKSGLEENEMTDVINMVNQQYYNTETMQKMNPLLLRTVFLKLYQNG